MLALALNSCKEDDEPSNDGDSINSEVVGTWYVDKSTYQYYTTIEEMKDFYDRTEVEPGDGAYWEFTSSKVTVHDPNDLANNKAVAYKYNKSKKELSIAGLTYQVKKLTSSKMTLYAEFEESNFGERITIEFSK